MGFDKLLIIRALGFVDNEIDEIDFAFLKGLFRVAFWLVVFWFIFYFLLWQAFSGYAGRTAAIVVIWLVVEGINWIGGGHSKYR